MLVNIAKTDALLIECYKFFDDPKLSPYLFKSKLNEIYIIKLGYPTEFMFKLGLEKKRPDLLLILFKKSIMDPFGARYSYKNMIRELFRCFVWEQSDYLRDLFSSSFASEINLIDICEILSAKVNESWLIASEYVFKANLILYYQNKHLHNSQQIIIKHPICANVINYMEKQEYHPYRKAMFYSKHKLYFKNNPELIKRTKARWTIIFFFAKYVIKTIQEWKWMPGGPMCKRFEKRWLDNIKLNEKIDF
jgi:hypothetical protein